MTLPLLVLDFETYFNSKAKYSLKGNHHTTESYVRSDLFKTHMLGYWQPDRMAAPAECNHDMLETNESLRRTIETSAVLLMHGHFDALILNHWYDLRPAFIYDILPMARLVLPRLKSHSLGALASYFGLPEKNVPYQLFDGLRDLPPQVRAQVADGCKHDVWLTKQIFDRLLPYVPEEELEVVSTTVKMFSEPVLELDRPRLETFLKAEKIRKAKAMLDAGAAMGMAFQMRVGENQVVALRSYLDAIETALQSSAKFKVALEALGYECPMKYSEKAKEVCETCGGAGGLRPVEGSPGYFMEKCPDCEKGKTKGGWIPAIAKSDEPMKELLEHEDPRVQALSSARLGVKSTLNETRAQRFLDNHSRGAMAVYLKYAGQKTLRTSGGDGDNWKNLPRGGEIRKSIRAPDSHKLVIGDLSQIEYRLLCWTTGQTDKLEALKSGRDLYVEFASELYGEPVEKSDKLRRTCGKVGVLQSGYGAGGPAIQRSARNATPSVVLTDEQGMRARDIYRTTHPCVPQFWRWCQDVALPALHHGQTVDYRHILHIEDHKIWLPNDTAIEYEGLRWARASEIFPGQDDNGEGPSWWEPTRKGYSRTWGSSICADIHQSLARVILMDILVRMVRKHSVRPCIEVYDELGFCVPDADVERIKAALELEMTTPPAWCSDIYLACEIIAEQNYEK